MGDFPSTFVWIQTKNNSKNAWSEFSLLIINVVENELIFYLGRTIDVKYWYLLEINYITYYFLHFIQCQNY